MLPRVLLVDDDEDTHELVQVVLRGIYDIRSVFNGREALALLEKEDPPDIILLDIQMPELNGLETCKLIKANPQTKDIPIIILSAYGDPEKTIQAGAEEYLLKPFYAHDLRNLIQAILDENEIFHQKKMSPLGGRILHSQDFGLTENNKRRFYEQDPLTGLPLLWNQFLEIRAELAGNDKLALILVSLSQPGKVEEICGWKQYDEFISRAAKILKKINSEILKGTRFLVTLNPFTDSFAFILTRPHDRPLFTDDYFESLKRLIHKHMTEGLEKEPFGPGLSLKPVVGVGYSSIYSSYQIRADRLLNNAVDQAYHMIRGQRANYFNRLGNFALKIIQDQQLSVRYQPIVGILPGTKPILAYESLVRGPVDSQLESPEILFQIAGKEGLLGPLERLVRDMAVKNAAGILPPEVKLFINLEVESFFDPTVKQMLTDKNLPLPPEQIVFEVTERQEITDYKAFVENIAGIRELGVGIALDDVGNGFSSLNNIARIKPDYIKLDLTLTRNIHRDSIKQELLETLGRFSRNNHITMIAEGIEEPEELDFVRKSGVPYAQGYLFRRPHFPLEILPESEYRNRESLEPPA